MAPPVLLTAEQARRNLELFQSDQAVAHAKSKIRENVPKVPSAASVGEVICRASALNLPAQSSPPPSSVETFRNSKLHLDVLSTFLATAMKRANYFPNESYNGKVDAATEFQGFSDLISYLQTFESYMPLIASLEYSQDSRDGSKELLEKVGSFAAESGIDATIITRDLTVQAASLTSTAKTSTVFVAYHLQGADSNPVLYIFYIIATMLRTDLGISVATPNQKIKVSYSKYQLNSDLVSRMAKELAITVAPAKKLTEAINTRFLLPS